MPVNPRKARNAIWSSGIVHFKLTYNVQKPYPGKWTTLIFCSVYVLLFVFLVLVNIPLVAYELVQELTTNPNDTTAIVKSDFLSLLPAALQPSPREFSPQIFNVGDFLRTNFSAFDYVIKSAKSGIHGDSISSFLYYNNPMSSCDVSYITLSLRKNQRSAVTAVVACWWPRFFRMTMTLNHASMIARTNILTAVKTVDMLLSDAEYIWDLNTMIRMALSNETDGMILNNIVDGIDLTVTPCCDACTDGLYRFESFRQPDVTTLLDPLGQYFLDHPSCDNKVAKFTSTHMQLHYGNGTVFAFNIVSSLEALLPSTPFSSIRVNTTVQNAFQAVYHAVRLDLGVMRENQIYASPSMFNNSVSTVTLASSEVEDLFSASTVLSFDALDGDSHYNSFADRARATRLESVNQLSYYNTTDFNTSVPLVSYLLPLFQLKSVASAITSVFASAYSIQSVVWTCITTVAASLFEAGDRRRKEARKLRRHQKSDLEASTEHRDTNTDTEDEFEDVKKDSESIDDEEDISELRPGYCAPTLPCSVNDRASTQDDKWREARARRRTFLQNLFYGFAFSPS